MQHFVYIYSRLFNTLKISRETLLCICSVAVLNSRKRNRAQSLNLRSMDEETSRCAERPIARRSKVMKKVETRVKFGVNENIIHCMLCAHKQVFLGLTLKISCTNNIFKMPKIFHNTCRNQ